MKKYRVVVNGEEYEVEVEELTEKGETKPGPKKPAPSSGLSAPTAPQKKKPASSSGGPGEIKAPMSGKVLKINAQPGEEISRGQVLMVLEAMKMENEITAKSDGKIKEIKVSEGASVNPGDVLVILE